MVWVRNPRTAVWPERNNTRVLNGPLITKWGEEKYLQCQHPEGKMPGWKYTSPRIPEKQEVGEGSNRKENQWILKIRRIGGVGIETNTLMWSRIQNVAAGLQKCLPGSSLVEIRLSRAKPASYKQDTLMHTRLLPPVPKACANPGEQTGSRGVQCGNQKGTNNSAPRWTA